MYICMPITCCYICVIQINFTDLHSYPCKHKISNATSHLQHGNATSHGTAVSYGTAMSHGIASCGNVMSRGMSRLVEIIFTGNFGI